MKICSLCKEKKPKEFFYKHSLSIDGLKSQCKQCHIKSSNNWNNSSDVANEWHKKWRLNNSERIKEKIRQWDIENKERKSALMAIYRAKNKEKRCFNESLRRSKKKKAIPNWANGFFIEEAYRLRALRTIKTGVLHHVDHIVPLASNKVCGLHWEGNLQVIPASQNLSKKNIYWPDMP